MSVISEQESVRTRRSFTDEFKRDEVALVIDEGRKIVDVGRSLGFKGRITIRMGEGDVELGPGELFVVPVGVEHQPFAAQGAELNRPWDPLVLLTLERGRSYWLSSPDSRIR